jgi:hypothetical protein
VVFNTTFYNIEEYTTWYNYRVVVFNTTLLYCRKWC